MNLRFLGTGTSTGSPEIGCQCEVCTSTDSKDQRFRSSALIEIGGKHILIDCGPDFRMQILEAFKKNPFEHLDGVLITHEHYDHVGGLDDLRTFCKEGNAVDIYAEEDVVNAIRERMPYAYKENKYPGVPNLQMITITDQPFFIDSIKIIPIRLMHGNLPIYGYRIENMAYLTDLKTIPESEYDKLKDLDVLIINALRTEDHISHQTIAEALENIKKIKPKRAFFTHMNHHFGLHEVVQKQLPSTVLVPYDGLELHINPTCN